MLLQLIQNSKHIYVVEEPAFKYPESSMEIVIFHSMYGLREVEIVAADQLRSQGYKVTTPDLYNGQTAPAEVDAGITLMTKVGWPTIVARARTALCSTSSDAILMGFSMGAGVISAVWPDRLEAAAVACIHGPLIVPAGVRKETPIQLHMATPDRFISPDHVQAFKDSAMQAGTKPLIREYPGVSHFFTDSSLEDFDEAAAASVWADILTMLDEVSRAIRY